VLVRADVETGVVEVQLQGACSSCAVSSATLSGGVERILRERLEWVTEVVGGLDDSLSMDESYSLGSGGYVRTSDRWVDPLGAPVARSGVRQLIS